MLTEVAPSSAATLVIVSQPTCAMLVMADVVALVMQLSDGLVASRPFRVVSLADRTFYTSVRYCTIPTPFQCRQLGQQCQAVLL